ncbi:TRAP transporter small permease subunit [Pseudorhodoplanes sp.]|uniref:TRAP transporter small permease subunit n=1 Tax=Pseudorhodoplanes sp. TaxID=1934341 RepID=UPI003D1211EA
MQLLDQLIVQSRNVFRWAAWLGGGLMLCCAFVVSFDVICRKLFGYTLAGSDELSSYAFAISTSWALAYALLERYQIRIDAIYIFLSDGAKAILDVLSLIAFSVFISFLTYRSAVVFATSIQFDSHANTPLQTPLSVPQGLWLIGLFCFAIAIVLLLIKALVALTKGDFRTVRSVCGIRTQEEEVADDLQSLSTGGRR